MQNTLFILSLTLLMSLSINNTINGQELKHELLFKIEIDVDTAINLGNTALGNRLFFKATGGTFAGPKLKGKILPTGGDWFLQLDSTTSKLDVRLLLKTEDEELIYSTYTGFIYSNSNGTNYWRISLFFETGSKKYSWLNHIIAVGVGRGITGKAIYDVYEIK